MPRRPRVHIPGGLYHAILRGNHRQVIFHGEDDYRLFGEILRAALARYDALLHAYCWMPNHVHLAIQVGEPPLGRVMHLLASRYARRKQRKIATTGHFFERRYRAKLVAADQYLLALVRYIHRNPERAGLVPHAGAYRWSSHHAYVGRLDRDWVVTAPTLALLGADADADSARRAYRRFMRAHQPDDDVLQFVPGGRGPAPGAPARAGGEWVNHPVGSPLRPLEQVVTSVAAELGVDVGDLGSRRRTARLTQARVEIASRALHDGVATLTEVAVRLGRAPSSLSELLARRGRH